MLAINPPFETGPSISIDFRLAPLKSARLLLLGHSCARVRKVQSSNCKYTETFVGRASIDHFTGNCVIDCAFEFVVEAISLSHFVIVYAMKLIEPSGVGGTP